MIVVVTAVMLTLMCTGALAASLDAPKNVTVELAQQQDGTPYFQLKWTNPQSILDMVSYWDENGEAPLSYQIDMKVGNGKWNYEVIGNTIPGNSLHAGYDDTGISAVNSAPYDPINAGDVDTIDIKANVYSFRVRYVYDLDDELTYGPFSNAVSTGMNAYYSNASSWATAELDKAAEYGLITDSIKNNMKGPITREEFAELATRLYEVYTGKKAEAASATTFTDTTNPEILKAFQLGIVNGVGDNKFDPKALTNREQIAAMLYRAVAAIKPDADLSTAGAPTFADEKSVAPYFLENVKFMAKKGFIVGSNNKFSPKDTCTREAAVLIAVRVYEAYK